MNDLISRQAAIDAINCNITVTGRQNAELVAATIGAFADRIKALPSAQKKGEWILKDSTEYEETITWYICSVCGDVGHPEYNYCSNCGADMRKEVE